MFDLNPLSQELQSCYSESEKSPGLPVTRRAGKKQTLGATQSFFAKPTSRHFSPMNRTFIKVQGKNCKFRAGSLESHRYTSLNPMR